MKWRVNQFSGNHIVIEREDGEIADFPMALFSKEVKIGDQVIQEPDGSFEIVKEPSEQQHTASPF